MCAAPGSGSPTETVPADRDAAHAVILRDEHGYCAHPHLIRSNGELLVVCNWAPRRPFVLHPPEDPLYLNLLLRSPDEGRTWHAPVVAPAYGWSGVECAGLTDLGASRVMLNQWQFDWLTLDAARIRADQTGITYPERLLSAHLASAEHEPAGQDLAQAERTMPWARAPGRSWVHRSEDGGRTWGASTMLDTAPFVGGYGMRGGVVLDDGTVVLPLCDIPDFRRVFVVRSTDGGAIWAPAISAASLPGRWFEEPAPLLLRSGRLLLLLRENASRTLWRTWSDDGGLTWADPEPTGIDGYPAHLTHLSDGRVLCTYGFRRIPYAIRAVLSDDDGASWTTTPTEIRLDLPSRDLGYPCTLPAADGLITVYYARQEDGCTCLCSTRWAVG